MSLKTQLHKPRARRKIGHKAGVTKFNSNEVRTVLMANAVLLMIIIILSALTLFSCHIANKLSTSLVEKPCLVIRAPTTPKQ